MIRLKAGCIAAAIAIAFALSAPCAQAAVLLEFDFENFDLGQVVGGHSAAAAGLSGSHNMANNGVEDFGAPHFKLSMTRFFGPVNFPVLTFTTGVAINLASIDFLHIHNHNFGFPTFPDYDVRLQIDTGSGFTDLGTFLAAPGGYDAESVAGPGLLAPGTYSLRWQPSRLDGEDTNTEFFGLDDIQLVGRIVPAPPTSVLLGLGLLGLWFVRRRIGIAS